jgi:hypothetical protein
MRVDLTTHRRHHIGGRVGEVLFAAGTTRARRQPAALTTLDITAPRGQDRSMLLDFKTGADIEKFPAEEGTPPRTGGIASRPDGRDTWTGPARRAASSMRLMIGGQRVARARTPNPI